MLVRTLPVVLALLLAPSVVAVPTGPVAPYTAGGVEVVGIGAKYQLSPGLPVGGTWTENLGGARLAGSYDAHNVIVSISDDLYGSNGALTVTMEDPSGLSDAVSSGAGCGTQNVLGSPWANPEAIVFTHVVLVTESFETCGATAGTVAGDFF